MKDQSTAAAFTPVCYMQRRNHATLLLHATLIFPHTIGRYTTHPDVSFPYACTIWNK
jgi:hypothetical protein